MSDALRDDPYEPVETVEDVVQALMNIGNEGGNGSEAVQHYATRLRTAHLHELHAARGEQ